MKSSSGQSLNTVFNHLELTRARFGVSEKSMSGPLHINTLLLHVHHALPTLLKDSHAGDKFHSTE